VVNTPSAGADQESEALRWLCEHVDTWREQAEQDQTLERLNRTLALLRANVPASVVCRRLGYDPSAPDATGTRGGTEPSALDRFNIEPVGATGDFGCPHGVCDRIATRDAHGHEPLCADGTPMLLRTAG
jgi:hypothetical protein